MNELIAIRKSGKKESVNAKELHEFLEVGRNFSTWIRQRVEKYKFIEGQDFIIASRPPVPGSGNRGAGYDYFISLDMAKELSMVENNEKGRQARQYFIDVEKTAKRIAAPTEEEILRNAFLILDTRVKKLEQKIEDDKDKVQFFHDVTGSRDAVEMGKVAKILDCGMGRNKLFKFLRDRDVLMKNNEPYQSYVDAGWFRVIEQKYEPCPGEVRISIKTLVYQKGIKGISKMIKEGEQ